MKSIENALEVEAITSDTYPTNDKKEEAGKFMYPLERWVTTGSTWFRSAKEKTCTTFGLVKKDLTEFVDLAVNEASSLANTTIESVKQQTYNLHQIMSLEEERDKQNEEERKKIKSNTNETKEYNSTYAVGWAPSMSTITDNSWIKTIVETVKNIAQENTVESEDEFTESIYPQIKSLSKSDLPHHILYEIQTNLNTYMKTPEGDKELFMMWCDDFNLAEYDSEINTLLANCPRVRALYQEMVKVPEQIENVVFWTRYFYKVHQMELLVRCKVDTEKQLLQDDENIIQRQKWKMNFGEKSSDRTENCLNVDTKLTQSQNSVDRRSAMDESCSLCSGTIVDIQELHDEDSPRTPKADSNNSSNKNDGWINWGE